MNEQDPAVFLSKGFFSRPLSACLAVLRISSKVVGMTDAVDLSVPWAKTAVGDVGQLAGQKLSQSSENVAAINQQQALARQETMTQEHARQRDAPNGPTIGARSLQGA